MAIITKSDLQAMVGAATKSAEFSRSIRLAETDNTKTYDVFLSHSRLDKETILQVNDLLEIKFGLKVYVDWIENPNMSRDSVTRATAAELRSVMNRCRTLLYAVSTNAASSKWMPWELGYSDARHGLVAILPIAEYRTTYEAYKDQEFVGLYPYVDVESKQIEPGSQYLWVNSPTNSSYYAMFDDWMAGKPLKHHA